MAKSILLIGNYPPPFGGVPSHIECLAPYLASKGWDVHILSSGRSGVERHNRCTIYKCTRPAKGRMLASSLPALLRTTPRDRFPHRSLLGSSPRLWLTYLVSASIGRRIIERASVSVISAYNLFGGGPVGALLSSEFRVPFVVSNFGEIYSHPGVFRKHAALAPYVCDRASRILSISRHCADSYNRIGLSPPVTVIPYGIDLARFSFRNDGSAIRNVLGWGGNDQVVLFVGRMTRDMGLHTLLTAVPELLATLDSAKVLIVGAGGELLHSASETAGRHPGRVIVRPDVPKAELPAYYAASSIVVAPTLGDRACGSLAALEAMGTGKPIIASRVGGIPEIVADGQSGILIPPDDPATLTGAMVRLLESEPLRKRMGAVGRRIAESRYDQDKTNALIEHVFTEVAGL
jgi:glycosyltransferase involved in cell wall biosynthesis